MAREGAQNTVRKAGLAGRLLLFGSVLLAYGSNFWPGRPILGAGLNVLGHPPYRGFIGIFVPHALLYTTIPALVCALLWWGFVRARLLPPPEFGNLKRAVRIGLVGGLISLVLTLGVVALTMPSGTIHWVAPDPWKVAGNVFSNFYEEFLYRGFILTALTGVFSFWPAAILSSAAWGLLHTQYPLSLRILIGLIGILFCWLKMRAASLWAPYVAHEVLDCIGDSLIG